MIKAHQATPKELVEVQKFTIEPKPTKMCFLLEE